MPMLSGRLLAAVGRLAGIARAAAGSSSAGDGALLCFGDGEVCILDVWGDRISDTLKDWSVYPQDDATAK